MITLQISVSHEDIELRCRKVSRQSKDATEFFNNLQSSYEQELGIIWCAKPGGVAQAMMGDSEERTLVIGRKSVDKISDAVLFKLQHSDEFIIEEVAP